MFFISCFRIISDTSSPFSDVRQQKSCRLPSVSLSLNRNNQSVFVIKFLLVNLIVFVFSSDVDKMIYSNFSSCLSVRNQCLFRVLPCNLVCIPVTSSSGSCPVFFSPEPPPLPNTNLSLNNQLWRQSLHCTSLPTRLNTSPTKTVSATLLSGIEQSVGREGRIYQIHKLEIPL